MVVVWTATTERFCDIIAGVNDTKANLLAAVQADHSEIAPSTLYALACVHERVPFVNGSPQNTFVPGGYLSRTPAAPSLALVWQERWFQPAHQQVCWAACSSELGLRRLWCGVDHSCAGPR